MCSCSAIALGEAPAFSRIRSESLRTHPHEPNCLIARPARERSARCSLRETGDRGGGGQPARASRASITRSASPAIRSPQGTWRAVRSARRRCARLAAMVRRMMPLRFREDDQHGSSTRLGDGDRWNKIRCPRCAWQPKRSDRWQCSCLHLWNTFETRGVCPECSYRWQETMCLRCAKWSPHAAWYVES
jgi:hypothetical protein